MAMIIFLIIAVLVAVGLVTMNMRAVSPRKSESVNIDSPPIGNKPEDVTSSPSTEDNNKATQAVIEHNDEHKMKDSDYRLALKKMQSTSQESFEPKQESKKEQIMNDDDYRETLKALSNKQKN
ncbi:hypothetical protein ELQ35_21020 [Peribacillus cavernae]|uniref:Uncharacterized protein n=1 Tax=Peribacillus cavernae TaxID=1674310 RepID=A0A433H908_9BACI|nr:hypothetical protein [Peribacillus cavernae]MDQ0220836.1 heme/copper-type cytochrome/quinol oxidase subunit 1 [Peribacillus cavernae]RUQ24844.1 hypothetical protein ELQ35_21020 [Peribacillus cavernae]